MNFTDAEVGLYIRLLCVQWSQGKLPSDKLVLSEFGKGETPLGKIITKFSVGKDGFLRNKRLEAERLKQKIFRKSRSDNGKKGGRPRKASEKLVVLKTEAKKSSPSPSPSPSPYKDDREKASPVELPPGFPQTESEAKAAAGFVGCTAEFAVETWFKAFARGGRDAKDVPIRSWQHYLASEKTFDANRVEREKARPVFRNGKPQFKADHEKGF